MSTNRITCANPYCYLPRRHQPDCDNHDNCRGCQPATAADGILLCTRCTKQLGEHAGRAARLYPLLAERLIPHRAGAGPSGTSTGAPVPDERVVALRTQIQRTLVDIARTIVERRGVHGPLRWTIRRLPDGVHGPAARVAVATGNREALADFIGRHNLWLAGQRNAGDIAARLYDIGRRGGPAWRAAFPHGPERLYVGDCPLAVTEVDGSEGVCAARLYQVPDQPLITCAGCGVADTIEQWERWIFGEEQAAEVDVFAAARALARVWLRPEVTEGMVRVWATRARHAGRELAVLEPDPTDPAGEKMRPKRDVRGRVQYRLAAVYEEARRHGWGEPPRPGRRAA